MRKTINVTAEDIENGIKSECCSCPVAVALQRTTGIVFAVSCSFAFPSMGVESGKYVWGDQLKLPKLARKFIDTFDSGQPVEPFSFELDIPLDVLKSK